MLKKYGISQEDFTYAYLDIELDKPWPEFYREASYRIGRDVFLSLDFDGETRKANISVEDINQEVNGMVKVEEVFSLWTGLCYRIEALYMTQPHLVHFIRMNFDQSMPKEDLPLIDMIFTSKNSSYGIIDLDWIDGNDFVVEVDPNYHLLHDVNLHPHSYRSLQEKSNCSYQETFYKCVSRK